MERRIGQDTAALGKTPVSCSAWNADRTSNPGSAVSQFPTSATTPMSMVDALKAAAVGPRQKCAPALLIGRVPGFALNYVPSSGAPCASRRHALGLTPTAAENTRVR